jgi:hypothetical protein
MTLEEYLKGEIARIGAPEFRASERKRIATLVVGAAVSVAAIVGGSVLTYAGVLPEGGGGPVVVGFGAVIGILPYIGIHEELSPAKKKRRELIARYGLRGPAPKVFAPETYAAAARALRDFRPRSLDVAEREYGAEAIDILIMTGTIYTKPKTPGWSRVVSIKAVEEDREADDEE